MRGRWMRYVVRGGVAAVFGGLLLSTGASLALAQSPSSTAEIKSLTGRVEVLRKGQSQWLPALVGAKLGEGDDIRTYAGAQAEFELPDTSTLVVAENSRLQLTRLEFDRQKQSRFVLVHLAVGKVRAVVAQAALTLVRARQSNFAISTPTAVAAARGTTMWVAHRSGPNVTAMAVEQVQLRRPQKGLIECIPLAQAGRPGAGILVPEEYSTEDCGPLFLTPPAFLSFSNPFAPGGPFSGPISVPPAVFVALAPPPAVIPIGGPPSVGGPTDVGERPIPTPQQCVSGGVVVPCP